MSSNKWSTFNLCVFSITHDSEEPNFDGQQQAIYNVEAIR